MEIDATTLAVLKAFVKQSGGSSSGEGGQDGREIELQKSNTAIQWRYVGDQEWTDLVQLSEIKGDTGAIANLTIGTVTTLDAGSSATASIELNSDGSGYVLNLGIPEGEEGYQIADYVNLNNKPSINGVEISGDKSAEDYGLKPSDFIVTIIEQDGNYTADQSVQSIIDAHDSGVTCHAIYNGLKYELQSVDKNRVIFANVFVLTMIRIIGDALADRDEWSVDVIEYAANYYSLGGVIADNATSDDTVPAKIGVDNKLYVPTYPTLESLNAQPKDFIVSITGDDVNGYTADKTYDEISEAYNAGKSCYANALGSKVPILMCTEDEIVFLMSDTTLFYILSVRIRSYDNKCSVQLNRSGIASTTDPGIVYAQDATVQDTLPVNVDENGFLKVAAKPKDFIVTVSGDTNDGVVTYTADKTRAEILEACHSGMDCYADYGLTRFPLYVAAEDGRIEFSSIGAGLITTSIYFYPEGNVEVANNGNIATTGSPGLVQADYKTDSDTQPVNIDEVGFLYTTPPKFTFNLTKDTENQTITADKTYTEIRAAYDAGRVVEGLMSDPEGNIDLGNNPKIIFGLCRISDNKMVFHNDYHYILLMIDNTNTWGVN